MIKKGLLALFAIAAWQCQDVKYPDEPENLIDTQTMVSIYTDTYLANASKRFNRTILLREGVELEQYIYKKYGVDSLQFEQSNAFYTSDIDLYKSMFEQVQDSLEVYIRITDSIIEVQKEKEARRRDSLRIIAEKRRDSLGVKIPDSLDIDLPDSPELDPEDTIINTARKRVQGSILPTAAQDSLQ